MLAQRSYPNLAMAILMVLIATFSTTHVSGTSPQTCTVTLPTGTWTGQTQNGVGNITATNNATSITDLGNNQFSVSDFSGGFIGHFGFSNSNALTIEIDCNDAVLTTSVETDYGTCQITGGSWDPLTEELLIEWTISNNRIIEATMFTLN